MSREKKKLKNAKLILARLCCAVPRGGLVYMGRMDRKKKKFFFFLTGSETWDSKEVTVVLEPKCQRSAGFVEKVTLVMEKECQNTAGLFIHMTLIVGAVLKTKYDRLQA